MKGLYKYLVLLLFAAVLLCSKSEPAKAAKKDVELSRDAYELINVEYPIGNPDSEHCITLTVLTLEKPELYEVRAYKKGYRIYKKGTRKYVNFDYLCVFEDNLYVSARGLETSVYAEYNYENVLVVNYALSFDRDRWIFFGEDGRLIKEGKAYGLFEVENGLFYWPDSAAHKKLREKLEKMYSEEVKLNFDYELKEYEYKINGFTKKESDKKIQEDVAARIAEVVDGNEPSRIKIGNFLNRIEAIGLGDWVRQKGYKAEKPTYEYNGKLVKDENGNLKFLVESYIKNTGLAMNAIAMRRHAILTTPETYKPDSEFEWVQEVVLDGTYMTNMAYEIDGDVYYFGEDGIAVANKWVDGAYYGADCKMVRSK